MDHGVLRLSGICPSKPSIQLMLEALKSSEDILEIDLSQILLEESELNNILKVLKASLNSVNTLKLNEACLGSDSLIHLSNMIIENHFLQR